MKNRHVLSLDVENSSGTLSKIAGLFTRRGFNIDSLNVSATETNDISRITISVVGDEYILEQITKQVNKLINVIKIVKLDNDKSICKELMYVRVSNSKKNRTELLEIIKIYEATVVDFTAKNLIIEVVGDISKIESFLKILAPYGIKEVVRTGLTAIERS